MRLKQRLNKTHGIVDEGHSADASEKEIVADQALAGTSRDDLDDVANIPDDDFGVGL